eukprot:GFUD01035143.1.p1 GENE.GFUD01035143.1~~GFUD01035143.1.p1  ORF type:complete len:224 (+),score=52.70 GFUD01035143.1:1079-1750(+)
MNRENKPICFGVFSYLKDPGATFNPQQAYDKLSQLQNVDTAQQTDQNEDFARSQRDRLKDFLNLPTDDKKRKRKICFLNKLRTKCYAAMKKESGYENLADLISKYESEVKRFMEHLAKPVERNNWKKKIQTTNQAAKKVLFSSDLGKEDAKVVSRGNENSADMKTSRGHENVACGHDSTLEICPETRDALLKKMLQVIEEKMTWKRKKKKKMKENLNLLFETL